MKNEMIEERRVYNVGSLEAKYFHNKRRNNNKDNKNKQTNRQTDETTKR